MYLLAGNADANLAHAENDARAENDNAVATKSAVGLGSVLPTISCTQNFTKNDQNGSLTKNDEILDPTGPIFSDRWTRIPGPKTITITRVKPGPGPKQLPLPG